MIYIYIYKYFKLREKIIFSQKLILIKNSIIEFSSIIRQPKNIFFMQIVSIGIYKIMLNLYTENKSDVHYYSPFVFV